MRIEKALTPNFLYFWLLEFEATFCDNFNLTYYIEPEACIYPLYAIKDVVSLVYSTNSSLRLLTNEGTVLIELSKKGEIIRSFADIQAFTTTPLYVDEASKRYSVKLHELLNTNAMYISNSKSKSHTFLSPHKGQVDLESSRPSILFGVPIHERFELTKVFTQYMVEYVISSLKWQGFNPYICFLGSQSDLLNLSIFETYANVIMLEHENNLGSKKNLVISLAKSMEFDYLINIDSDDFFSPSSIIQLIEYANKNTYWSAIEPFGFYDSNLGTHHLFEGYPDGHQLSKSGMGSGRVFTKELLNYLPSEAFSKGNKSMDTSIKSALDKLNIAIDDRLIPLDKIVNLPIGIKTSQNIWSLNTYKTQPISKSHTYVAWLPSEIASQINSLQF